MSAPSIEQAAGKQGVHAGQVGQEEAGEQRHLFMTAGHLGIVRLWDSRSTVLLPPLLPSCCCYHHGIAMVTGCASCVRFCFLLPWPFAAFCFLLPSAAATAPAEASSCCQYGSAVVTGCTAGKRLCRQACSRSASWLPWRVQI